MEGSIWAEYPPNGLFEDMDEGDSDDRITRDATTGEELSRVTENDNTSLNKVEYVDECGEVVKTEYEWDAVEVSTEKIIDTESDLTELLCDVIEMNEIVDAVDEAIHDGIGFDDDRGKITDVFGKGVTRIVDTMGNIVTTKNLAKHTNKFIDAMNEDDHEMEALTALGAMGLDALCLAFVFGGVAMTPELLIIVFIAEMEVDYMLSP
jgi:hypothetical protein